MLKILRYLKNYKLATLFAILFIFAQTMFDLNLPKLMSQIVDSGIMSNDTPEIVRIGLIMLGFTLLSAASTIVASYLLSKVGAGLSKDVRSDVFKKVTYYSADEMNKIGTASLITRTTNDITQLQQFIIMSRMMIGAPIMMIGGIIMAVSQAPSLSWIIIVIIAVITVIMGIMLAFIIPLFKKNQKKLDKLNLVLREFLTGMRVIRAFNRSDDEKKRFTKANRNLMKVAFKINIIISILFPTMMFIMNASTVGIIWFGGFQVDAGHIEIGALMAFIQYAMQIMFSVLMFSMIFFLLPRAQVSAKRINKVLGSESTIQPSATPVKDFGSLKGVLEFRNVTFRHKGAEEPVLKNISFKTTPGETTAIIGGTGSGKSTLIDLIPRFYDIESGEILIDGINIKDMSFDDLRQKIGIVPQKNVLFSGTIEENIKYGKEDASYDEVVKAATVAQCMEFINEKSEGIDTYVSQGGSNLSGGQKQRLAIARALVRNPEIYIFDDSFSALDFATDSKLRAALKENIHNKTMLVVAQRVSTIMDAGQIIVLDHGEIVGLGTHKELYKNNEVYKEIVLSQLSEEEAA